MEIITFEKKTLDTMNYAFERFVKRMDEMCLKHGKRASEWLDSSDVCQLLNISKHTLQTYRDNGTLPYSQINHKMFYKHSDIKQLLSNTVNKAA